MNCAEGPDLKTKLIGDLQVCPDSSGHDYHVALVLFISDNYAFHLSAALDGAEGLAHQELDTFPFKFRLNFSGHISVADSWNDLRKHLGNDDFQSGVLECHSDLQADDSAACDNNCLAGLHCFLDHHAVLYEADFENSWKVGALNRRDKHCAACG